MEHIDNQLVRECHINSCISSSYLLVLAYKLNYCSDSGCKKDIVLSTELISKDEKYIRGIIGVILRWLYKDSSVEEIDGIILEDVRDKIVDRSIGIIKKIERLLLESDKSDILLLLLRDDGYIGINSGIEVLGVKYDNDNDSNKILDNLGIYGKELLYYIRVI